MPKATVINPKTGERKQVTIGDPNAFAGGFRLETAADRPAGSPLEQAERNYNTARSAVQQGTLDQMDLRSMFESAAKQANPNYGLSRVELLAKYKAPKYSDTKSSEYIDPDVRIAMADRLAQGYQGVLGQAADRASAIFGRDVQARQFAAENAGEQYGRLYDEDLRQKQRQESLEDLEKQLQIQRRYSGGSGTSDPLLTVTEAERFGVPYGTRRSQVVGNDVPDKGYQDFARNLITSNGYQSLDVDPQSAYIQYQRDQQQIYSDPSAFNRLVNDPGRAPYAHLLKPSSSNSLFSSDTLQQLGQSLLQSYGQ